MTFSCYNLKKKWKQVIYKGEYASVKGILSILKFE